MDSLKLIAIGELHLGVILLALSLPLMLRMVPMNNSFGIRIRAAFESEQRWYDLNAYGGRQLALSSLLMIIAGMVGFFVPPDDFIFYISASFLVAIFAIGLPCLMISRWIRKQSPPNH